MSKSGDNIRIPLPDKEALRLLFKVKPTEEMPRPGAQATKPKAKPPKKKTTNK